MVIIQNTKQSDKSNRIGVFKYVYKILGLIFGSVPCHCSHIDTKFESFWRRLNNIIIEKITNLKQKGRQTINCISVRLALSLVTKESLYGVQLR